MGAGETGAARVARCNAIERRTRLWPTTAAAVAAGGRERGRRLPVQRGRRPRQRRGGAVSWVWRAAWLRSSGRARACRPPRWIAGERAAWSRN